MTPEADNAAPGGTLARLFPGVALSAAISAVALALAAIEQALLGRIWLDALVLAILAGAAIGTMARLPASVRPGIAFSAKTLLELAVVLIGANIGAAAIMAAGWALPLGIAAVVAGSLALSYAIGRALGLSGKLALLIAAGNSICGNSAIAAVAPVIGADARDVAASVAFTAVLGIIVVLVLPLLAVAWAMSPQSFGIFAGLTVYAVPQVLAATAPISSLSAQVGTFVKLIRVLMLGPLVVTIALIRRNRTAIGQRPPLSQLVPWFIIGFVLMMTLRSLGAIPEALLPLLSGAATILTLMAMAALGLGVDLRDIAAAGPRATAAVTLSILVLGALALALIWLAGLA